MIVNNCSFKKVVKHHGVSFLEKKQKSLTVNISNKNDIIDILGTPSTTSKFVASPTSYICIIKHTSRLFIIITKRHFTSFSSHGK